MKPVSKQESGQWIPDQPPSMARATLIEADPVKIRAALDAAAAKIRAMNRPPRIYTTEQVPDARHET